MHTALRPEQAVSQLNHSLKPHQQRVVERICRRSQLGLVVAHGLGSGKTLTSIAAQEALGLDADIVVPATLIHNYEKEVAFHLSAPSQLRRTIRSLQAVTKRRELMESPLLIVDEAHRAREGQNVTFRNIFRTTAHKRLCLTASPFYNHPADLLRSSTWPAAMSCCRTSGMTSRRCTSRRSSASRHGGSGSSTMPAPTCDVR